MIAKHKETAMIHSRTSNGVIAQKILTKLYSTVVIIERRPWLAGSILTVIFLALFSFLQRHSTILDSDAFYHAKMTQFLSWGVLIKDFPWLPFTILADYYTDHHFLYHVILVPFVWIFDPLIAMKVAIVVLGVAALLVYFWALRRLGAVGAFWWTILAATSWPFLFRLNLVKALPLSLIIFLVGIVALRENRLKLLALLSFIYVWTYGGWPLLLFTAGLYSGILLIVNIKQWRDAIASFTSALLGSAAGVIINPYFPANIKFYERQIIDIALIPTNINAVGREWFRFPPFELFTAAALLFIVALIIAIFSVIGWLNNQSYKYNDSQERSFYLTSAVLGVVLFFSTVASQRYIEYFIPLGYLAVALWMSVLVRSEVMAPFLEILNNWLLTRARYMLAVLLLIIAIAFGYVGRGVLPLDKRFKVGWSLTYLKGAIEWFESRYPGQTLVYNVRWDDFPELFYFSNNLRYVSGLDIRFFNKRDKSDLTAWEKLYQGTADNPSELIRETFGANYVFVSQFNTTEAIKMLEDNNFPVLYKDDEAIIYAVP